MRQPKFNFVPERQLEENRHKSSFFTASIGPKEMIFFNKEYCNVYELDNKFVRFYANISKRTIAWKIIEGKTDLKDELSDSRKLKANKVGMIMSSITKILSSVGWQKGDKYLKLPIQVYNSLDGEYYYVKLPDKFLETK